MPFTTLLIDDEPAAHYALKELLKIMQIQFKLREKPFPAKKLFRYVRN